MLTLNYQIVQSASELQTYCRKWRQVKWVALDTEFLREDTYFPIPALIQLYDGDSIYLIDPLAIDDFSPFSELLVDPSVTKVMHSCSEDLEVFRSLCNVVPRPLFDTQIAAAYCDIGFSLGYQTLVQLLLDVSLDKGETRSNWLRRPLNDQQLQYAAHDVRWLPELHTQILEKLESSDRVEWFNEDMIKLLDDSDGPVADQLIYLRIKASSRLAPKSLNLLRLLVAWREKKAREIDVPKQRVINDAALMTITEVFSHRSINKETLAEIDQLSAKQIRKYGDSIIDMVNQHLGDDCVNYPPRIISLRLPQFRVQLKAMKKAANQIAGNLGVPIEILARRRDMEEFLAAPATSVIANSWRKQFLFDKFSTIVAE